MSMKSKVNPSGNGSRICLPSEISELSRRQLLQTGISMTGYASLASLLGLGSAQAQTSFTPQRNLVWINMGGGWDILEVTDPKPQSTSGIDMIYNWGEAQDLAQSTDGTKIGRWLPQIAGLGSDLLVLRGLAMGTTSHMAGNVYMDTGILSNAGRVNAASIPSIVASESTATIPIIQLGGGNEPQTDRGLLNPVSVVRAQNLDLYRSMYPDGEEALDRKMAVLNYLRGSIERLQAEVGSNDRLDGLAAAEDKVRGQFADNVGAKLELTNEERTAFSEGAPANLNRGALDSFALTQKLITGGICTCINLGIGGFDTHAGQTQRLQPILESVDFLITRLAAGLRSAGMLDNTLIVLYSDFGRTPKVNNSNGRDHWPTGGALVVGGGIDGGRTVGATDDDLNAVTLINPESGRETTDSSNGVQLNPTHLGGMVLELTLGSAYSQYRPYLESIPALTRLKVT